MPDVALPIPTGHRLGVEDTHSPEGGWNSMESNVMTWLSSPIPSGRCKRRPARWQITACLGLKIHRGKSKVLKNNAAVSVTPITQEGIGLEDVTSFTYVGRIVD